MTLQPAAACQTAVSGYTPGMKKPSSLPSIDNLPQLPLERRGAGQERPVTSIVGILRPAPGDTGYQAETYLLIRRIKPPYPAPVGSCRW